VAKVYRRKHPRVADTQPPRLRTPDSGLKLALVYNPQGPVLPPAQGQLEADYRTHLGRHYGLIFNELYILTNMPIQRFGSMLISKGQFGHYMDVLKNAYQPANLDNVDVPQPDERRLARLRLRLRLQSDARPAARPQGRAKCICAS